MGRTERQRSAIGNLLSYDTVDTAVIVPQSIRPPEFEIASRYASLNLFVAAVGKSGESKSASTRASSEWLSVEPDYEALKPGSGEGLAKCFAYKTKMPNVGGWVHVGKQWSVLAQIPEADTLSATRQPGRCDHHEHASGRVVR